MFIAGIAFFAIAILVSVALHECGHMWMAQATGMKVRRYFVGFGPTLWSTRKGEIEYGIKAIPAGGFCDIAGMTTAEELTPDEQERAMYKQKIWKRIAVLAAGPGMNFLLGFLLVYMVAVIWGLPNLNEPTNAMIGKTVCVASETVQGQLDPCTGPGPAERAGIRPGDIILEIGNDRITNFEQMALQVRKHHGPTRVLLQRGTEQLAVTVDIAMTQRWVRHGDDATLVPEMVGAIGVGAPISEPVRYNLATALPATIDFGGHLSTMLVTSLKEIPGKSGALVHAITNPHDTRDPETPMSVVGASIIGGESIQHGLWVAFWFFLAQLNFVLGILNFVPLLPFDGGHIAIACYEKIRNVVRKIRGLEDGDPVNYLKLMPVTYVILAVVVGYMLLTVVADFINPVRLF